MASKAQETYVCTNCHYQGRPKIKGHFIIELLLFFCFVIPGLIYTAWRKTSKGNICPQCGSSAMIPSTTPRGQELMKENRVQNQ